MDVNRMGCRLQLPTIYDVGLPGHVGEKKKHLVVQKVLVPI